MITVGIDVGGMSFKVGLVDEQGNIIAKNATESVKDVEIAVGNMVGQVNSLLSEQGLTIDDVDGVGIGLPGTVSSDKGMISYLDNLGWMNIPIVELFYKYFDKPILISNDANVATLAEALYGCAKGCDSCIMFTLGTGVGGGIIIDKHLYEGVDSKGAELGHVTLILDGESCNCGRNGCVESYVSATALIRQTKNAMINNLDSLMWKHVNGDIEKVNGKTAFECEKLGDATAEKVISTYIKYLSESMMNMMNIFRPDVFILGGGISNQGDNLLNKVINYCERFDYGYKLSPKPKIKIAKLGNDAGIIGAAALLRQK